MLKFCTYDDDGNIIEVWEGHFPGQDEEAKAAEYAANIRALSREPMRLNPNGAWPDAVSMRIKADRSGFEPRADVDTGKRTEVERLISDVVARKHSDQK